MDEQRAQAYVNLIEQKIAIPKLQVLVYPILQFLDFTLPAYRV